jgi:hypothetical protein
VKQRPYYWLAVIPSLGMLCGIPFVNRATPLIFGLPPLLAWMIGWILVTPMIMGLILTLDRRREK